MAKKFDMKALWAWVIDLNYELKAYLSQGENECQIEMTDCNEGLGQAFKMIRANSCLSDIVVGINFFKMGKHI